MKCSVCGSFNLSVKETRTINNSIRRRRICRDCNNCFTTYETMEKPSRKTMAEVMDDTGKCPISEDEMLAIFREEFRNAIINDILKRRTLGESFASIAKTFNCTRQNIQQYLGHKKE